MRVYLINSIFSSQISHRQDVCAEFVQNGCRMQKGSCIPWSWAQNPLPLPDLHSSLSPSVSLPYFIPVPPSSLLLLYTFYLSFLVCLLLTIHSSLPISSHCTPHTLLQPAPPNITLPPPPTQICSACVRCKSCGATPGKNWDVEWSGDYSLCPRCTQLYEKGGDLSGDLGDTGQWARLLDRQDRRGFLVALYSSCSHRTFSSVHGSLPQKPIQYLKWRDTVLGAAGVSLDPTIVQPLLGTLSLH